MSEHIALGDMVEGQKTSVVARKIIFKKRSLQKHEITKKLMVAYSMDRNCSVEVTEEIQLTDEEIAARAPYRIFRGRQSSARGLSYKLPLSCLSRDNYTLAGTSVPSRHDSKRKFKTDK